ncbi:hypothetical protein BGZ65_010882 [Modicella reniformis]|uniref:Uncharacterized protein n=1 Tax=Modicella reniformis TaxID=1440133 RepID=A0A9P6M3A9_9FUNG|nr:hypothetical protein BGZ65_010882 [Modicella reniformis]
MTTLNVHRNPVDVTLFVMSRCPDAMKCEAMFSKVFQTEDLPPVDPLLSYIGTVERKTVKSTTDTTTITTVTCLHGQLECAGNTQQLCFKKYFSDHRIWVPFVVTMNSWHPSRIGDPSYAREVAEKVVETNGIDNIGYRFDSNSLSSVLDEVDKCSKGQEGFDLLVESVEHTMHHGVRTSCTIFIDDKKRCVFDGGLWRECPEGGTLADFVRSIKEAASRVTRNMM